VAFVFVSKGGSTWLGQDRSADSCVQQQKSKFEEAEWTAADRNHEAILLIPDILGRLVKLLALDKVSFNREVRHLPSGKLFGSSWLSVGDLLLCQRSGDQDFPDICFWVPIKSMLVGPLE
jgi:hypothetical protein